MAQVKRKLRKILHMYQIIIYPRISSEGMHEGKSLRQFVVKYIHVKLVIIKLHRYALKH